MVSVIVAAFNEEDNVRGAVENSIRAAKLAGNIPIEVIIVNDGSTDRTGEVAEKLAREFSGVRVVHHEKNTGLGSTLVSGIDVARYDKITLFPGDNAVHPYTMQNIFKNAHQADMVLSYYLNTEVRSTWRLILSSLFTNIYCFTFGIHVKYINGTPLYSIPLLRELGPLNARRYSLLAELHVKLLRRGTSFYEIEGYLKPSKRSSAIKFNSLREVMTSYLKLVYEVYMKNPHLYRGKSKRVMPFEQQLNESPMVTEGVLHSENLAP